MKQHKPCKRCNGTGRVYEDNKGEKVDRKAFGFTMKGGSDSKGQVCPRCYGKGVR